jgi:hypothetical protein
VRLQEESACHHVGFCPALMKRLPQYEDITAMRPLTREGRLWNRPASSSLAALTSALAERRRVPQVALRGPVISDQISPATVSTIQGDVAGLALP